MRCLLALLPCLLLAHSKLANSSGAAERISDYRFDKAELTSTVQPRYPRTELGRGIEGWAVFSVIVDKEGNVVEPILIDSSGRKNFEKNAKKAVRKFKYQPAQLNGEAIESSDNKVYVSFAIAWDKPGANKRFASRFSTIRDQILAGKLDGVSEQIDKLENEYTRNRYEQAWLQALKSSYYSATGDENNHIKALSKAVAYNAKNLPPKIYASNLVNLYNAQIKLGKIKDAFTTADKAKELVSETPELAKVVEHKANIIATLDSIPLLHTTGSIDSEKHQWNHSLLRKSMGIELKSGKLNTIEFRCANKIRRFDINKANQSWNTPESWGDCTVFVSGEKGSRFELLEQAKKT
ncbi:energy transducer TonB [Pseudoteredinibacter isoporae]|uniref:energy transducer TonB n=1 Tax=Pseudoteredinibacter isoporae TaxID=570281 RepID=UPI003102BFEB